MGFAAENAAPSITPIREIDVNDRRAWYARMGG